jgi:hypothetical protein
VRDFDAGIIWAPPLFKSRGEMDLWVRRSRVRALGFYGCACWHHPDWHKHPNATLRMVVLGLLEHWQALDLYVVPQLFLFEIAACCTFSVRNVPPLRTGERR